MIEHLFHHHLRMKLSIIKKGKSSLMEDNFEVFPPKEDEKINKKERKTSVYLTKYEKARVLGMRSVQISMNAPVSIDTKGETDPLMIAIMELEQGKIEMIIRRNLPDGTYEDFEVAELLL